jgi:hypothetical protein
VRFFNQYHDADSAILDRPAADADSDFGLLKLLLQVWGDAGMGALSDSAVIDPDRMTAIDYPMFLTEVLGRIRPLAMGMLAGFRRPMLDELDRLAKTVPTGILVLFQGALLFVEGESEAAERAALRAAEMPSLLKIRRMALVLALVAEQQLLQRPVAPRDLYDRVRRNIEALIATRDADPRRNAFLVGLAVRVGEVDLARSVVAAWERRSPSDPEALAHRAAVEWRGGSYSRAIAAAQQTLRAKPGHRLARLALDASLRLQCLETRALAAELPDYPPPEAVDFFNRACGHALCAARLADENNPPAPAESADRKAHADQAMAALRRAVDAGWRNPIRLAQEPALGPLRSRDDFQRLLMSLWDLTFPTDAFGMP